MCKMSLVWCKKQSTRWSIEEQTAFYTFTFHFYSQHFLKVFLTLWQTYTLLFAFFFCLFLCSRIFLLALILHTSSIYYLFIYLFLVWPTLKLWCVSVCGLANWCLMADGHDWGISFDAFNEAFYSAPLHPPANSHTFSDYNFKLCYNLFISLFLVLCYSNV